MTEQDIIDMGFEYQEGSLEDIDFHYYKYTGCGTQYGTLYSSENDVSGTDGWYVMFGDTAEYRFYEREEVEKLIPLLKKGYIPGGDIRSFKLKKIMNGWVDEK